jgi:hypothetical protein
MVEPSREDKDRSVAIRCASKQGRYVSKEDSEWNYDIYRMFPEWYASTENQIFQLTKPFGSK